MLEFRRSSFCDDPVSFLSGNSIMGKLVGFVLGLGVTIAYGLIWVICYISDRLFFRRKKDG
uniref:Uncharacterized protein n=1 Tax=viral metagenome TaxID=1070528 RepID=A0A6M3IQ83_9ZZZZ